MAGDWIKMRTDLRDDPSVIGIAVTLGMDEDHVVGKLHKLWSWATQQLRSRNAPVIDLSWIDRYLGVTGFANAMVNVGWLRVEDDQIVFPNWERHNSKSAKQRALAANRAESFRRNASVTQQALRRRYQRREEKRDVSYDTSKAAAADVVLIWNAISDVQHCHRLTYKRKATLAARLKDPDWCATWQRAIALVAESDFCRGGGSRGWKADIDWFLKPDTVTKLLEGKYANREAGNGDYDPEPCMPLIQPLPRRE
jgi:hypothetical protein